MEDKTEMTERPESSVSPGESPMFTGMAEAAGQEGSEARAGNEKKPFTPFFMFNSAKKKRGKKKSLFRPQSSKTKTAALSSSPEIDKVIEEVKRKLKSGGELDKALLAPMKNGKYNSREPRAKNDEPLDLEDLDLKNNVKDAYCVFRDEALKYKLLNYKQEIELSKLIEMGDDDAFDLLVNSNLRLVIACARQVYAAHGKTTILDFMDLIQEGVMGLITAALRYNWRKNTRFSTYAVPWICQHIVRAIDSQKSGFSIPGHAGFSVRSMKSQIRNYLAGELDVESLSRAKLKRLKELATLAAPLVVLDPSDEYEHTPGVMDPETIICKNSKDDSDILFEIEAEQYKREFHKILQEILNAEEYDLLCRRHGMGRYESYGASPVRQMAEDIGKSAEYVRLALLDIERKLNECEKAETLAAAWIEATEGAN